jgi:hypothetical protein
MKAKTDRGHRARSTAELAAWLEVTREQGGGVWQLAVVSALNMEAFVVALAAGDEDAVRTRSHVNRAVRSLNSFVRPSKRAPMCLLCPAVLWRDHVPHAIAVLTPLCDEPRQGVFQFVCRECVERFADADELRTALLDYYRTNVVPELRILPPITSAPGHA